MIEDKKVELKEEIKQRAEILFYAQESLKIVQFLCKSEDDEDRSYVKGISAFFAYSVDVHWRTTVLELTKLLSDSRNQDFRLTEFIKKFKKEGYYEDENIPEIKIAEWEATICNEQEAIDNLIKQRDKLYAHTDKDHERIINTVSIEKARHLVEIIQKMIREICLELLEYSYMIDQPINSPIQNLEYIISTLADHEKENRVGQKYFGKTN